ncbi:hypothetical protein CW663_00905 [Macrococcoides caseolyticum]|nr:hypothetical protein CW718_01870 [Macrococcus caseolyticus]PKE68973.1 hypothetical protein CW663_00905 [Macrococcus caseolyticus]
MVKVRHLQASGDHLKGLGAEHGESSPPTSVKTATCKVYMPNIVKVRHLQATGRTHSITPTYNIKKLPDL